MIRKVMWLSKSVSSSTPTPLRASASAIPADTGRLLKDDWHCEKPSGTFVVRKPPYCVVDMAASPACGDFHGCHSQRRFATKQLHVGHRPEFRWNQLYAFDCFPAPPESVKQEMLKTDV